MIISDATHCIYAAGLTTGMTQISTYNIVCMYVNFVSTGDEASVS
jgi:hypothetical protein